MITEIHIKRTCTKGNENIQDNFSPNISNSLNKLRFIAQGDNRRTISILRIKKVFFFFNFSNLKNFCSILFNVFYDIVITSTPATVMIIAMVAYYNKDLDNPEKRMFLQAFFISFDQISIWTCPYSIIFCLYIPILWTRLLGRSRILSALVFVSSQWLYIWSMDAGDPK